MTVLLSLVAAAAYGLADFVGGAVSKRVSPWSVALCAQAVGTAVTLVLALVTGSHLEAPEAAWALVAGVGNGLGTAFLYRGLSSGRMGVVAPISGVGAALVPVTVGVAIGERPSALVWVGILAAFPAIWLVSRQPGGGAPAGGAGSGTTDGVLAGLGFGLLFVGLSRVSADGALLGLSLNQALGGVVIALVATTLRQPWVPRQRRALLGGFSGVLGATATGLFLLASRGGDLTVAAVVVSLYPAFTVVLAALVLREAVHRTQGLGLALCACSVALVAAG